MSSIPPVWVFATLAALALYAVSNIIDKVLRVKHVKNSAGLTLLFMLKSVAYLAFLPFITIEPMQPFDVLLLAALGLLWAIVAYPYIESLSFEEVSRTVPIWNISPIFVLILSSIFLQERLSTLHYFSFALLLAGGVLVSTRFEGIAKITLSKSFNLMLISVFAFSVSIIITKYLLLKYNFWMIFALGGLAAIIPTFAAIMLKDVRKTLLTSAKSLNAQGFALFITSSALGLFGSMLYTYAFFAGPVALVASMDGFQSLFLLVYTLLLSRYLPKILKEEISPGVLLTKLTAIFLMFAGLFLLYV